MNQKALYFSLTAATILIGVGAFSYSTVACSCGGPALDLASRAGINLKEDNASEKLEAGLNASFSSKKISVKEFKFIRTYKCPNTTATTISCHVPYKRSLLVEKGFDVDFYTDSNGTFIKTKVRAYKEFLP